MDHEGPAFYDNAAVFETYARHRERAESPNDTLERPVIMELVGDPAGSRFLDLGCGGATFGRELLAAGAASYLGVDGSANMMALAAQALAGTAGEAVHANLLDWAYPPDTFDRVTSRLALHYLPDLDRIFALVHRTLRPGGRFVYSVEHPVITACDRAWDDTAPRGDWLVDDYFKTGQRVTTWLGAQVIKYHRTVEDHFLGLQRAGFTVESVRESRPQRAHFASDADYARRQRIPLFLFMAAAKAGPATGR